MVSWTTPEAVIGRWLGGGEPEADDPKLLLFIEDAEDVIRAHFSDMDARITAEQIPLQRVQRVVARIVIRAWKAAYSQLVSFSRATGPFSESGTFEGSAKKYVSLTAEDIADLTVGAVRQYKTGMTTLSSYGGPADIFWQGHDPVRK